MSPAFLTFQRFNDPALAGEIAEKLKENGIECQIIGDDGPIDPLIMPTTAVSSVSLMVRDSEIDRANAILEAYYEGHLTDIDPEYFLYSFSDAELKDVRAKPDEWGPLNYVLAKKILADRGVV